MICITAADIFEPSPLHGLHKIVPVFCMVQFEELVDTHFAGFVSFFRQAVSNVRVTLPKVAIEEDSLLHVVGINH